MNELMEVECEELWKTQVRGWCRVNSQGAISAISDAETTARGPEGPWVISVERGVCVAVVETRPTMMKSLLKASG